MKKLLSLLLMVLMLLGGAAFAEENEEDKTPAVAPIVTFKSGFYVGYLDREIKITVSCKNIRHGRFRAPQPGAHPAHH